MILYTAFFAALLGLLIAFLAANVSRLRIKYRVSVGDGEIKPLRGAIRAHGNAVEHIVPALVLLLIYELQGASSTAIVVLGVAFTLARLLHAWGMLAHLFLLRRSGAAVTFIIEALLSILLLSQFLTAVLAG